MSIASTFDSHWKRDANGCWVWQRARQGKEAHKGGGYGCLRVDGKVTVAHRFSYELCHGRLPADLQIRHMCHNTLCVNPLHMAVGTNDDNVQDRLEVGRYANKLCADRVARIRKLFSAGATKASLARRFGVSECTVYDIVLKRTWRHV